MESFEINTNLNTGLPQGQYCDIISGFLENGRCTGETITVGGDGHAHIRVCGGCEDPVVAIHIGQYNISGHIKKNNNQTYQLSLSLCYVNSLSYTCQ